MEQTTIRMYADIADIVVKITVLISAAWGVYKFVQYRELKQRIQLTIDANIYRLTSPEQAAGLTWDRQGNRQKVPVQSRTHAIEMLLTFTNKGFTRMRLFNVQIGVNTMRPQNEAQFDQEDGHLHLTRIFTSGNIVPLFPVKDRPVEETSFYYIEPGVQQTISPREKSQKRVYIHIQPREHTNSIQTDHSPSELSWTRFVTMLLANLISARCGAAAYRGYNSSLVSIQ
jgi:hypothetical protein